MCLFWAYLFFVFRFTLKMPHLCVQSHVISLLVINWPMKDIVYICLFERLQAPVKLGRTLKSWLFFLFQFSNSPHWPFLVFLHIHVFCNAELNEAYPALFSVSCCHDLAGPPSFHVISIGWKKASCVSLVTSL